MVRSKVRSSASSIRKRRALVVGVRAVARGLAPAGALGPGVLGVPLASGSEAVIVIGPGVLAERTAGLSQDQVAGRPEADGESVG